MRFLVWLVIGIGLILLLKSQFPYAVNTPDQMAQIVYLFLILVLIAGGSGMMKRVRTTQMARDAMIWLGIILALVLGYSFRNDLRYSRLAGELIPSRIQRSADGGLSIAVAEDGHFHMEAEVNGVMMNFLIDTGASDIVLSPEDAQLAGYPIETLNYSRIYHTANGNGKGAPVIINTLVVGPFTLNAVAASVNSVAMDESLLGMAFLKQFKEYHVSGDTLTLYP